MKAKVQFNATWFSVMFIFILYISIARDANGAPNQQLSFTHTDNGTHLTYDYTWYDHNNILQHINFNLDKQAFKNLPTYQINYKPRLVKQVIRRDLMRLASRVDPRRARVEINQVGSEIKVGIRSSNRELVTLLNDEFSYQKELTFDLYLKNYYYEKFTTANGEKGIKADHVRYISEFTIALKPAAEAFYELLNDQATNRNYINLILSWAQSIPYNELTGRGEANGSGFFPPISLLNANLGDCDSKSVLVAALIRNHMPIADFKLLILPNHALLGIDIPHDHNDEHLTGDGEDLVVLEPTGPAPIEVGQLGETSKNFIDRGLVTYQSIPIN